MKEIKVRLNADTICDGLIAVKDVYEKAYQDFDIVFTEGEYGTGQIKLTASIRNLLSDAVSLIQEQKDEIERLKKNESKMVQSIRMIANRTFGYCPSCGRGLDSYHDGNSGEHITHFCYNCGQEVKWE